MKLRARALAVLSVLAISLGGVAATATPAAAVGGCPSGKLCLYEGTNYNRLAVTSTSTQACVYLRHFGSGFGTGIASYVNNLPVNAVVYNYRGSTDTFAVAGTIRPSGFSSNSLSVNFGVSGAVCMGGVSPS
ncbi:peptidase inhibitor family I36 protein [Streptomyces microflavus]|uniref:peptidase inhibitor family I36 protein n=1 Tax=Streptomyces microflavus TaxID=1919 RepID=UPI00386D3E9D|nr:peptidase inhibitor family I36 protein [Streptomyces microflavus]WST18592.1 peptidase inhibitor family I36 protein [Streptomyces microflavus]